MTSDIILYFMKNLRLYNVNYLFVFSQGHKGRRRLVTGHSTEMSLSEETSPDSEEVQ